MINDIEYLVSGYKKFRQKYFDGDGNSILYNDLVKFGQNPKTLFIACSDSRVDPAIVMSCQPGDVFVVRNVANLVPPYEDDSGYHGTSAAIEFAVCGLDVNHIVIFGHSQCGGIQSMFQKPSYSTEGCKSFVEKWMQIAKPAYEIIEAEHSNLEMSEKVEACSRFAMVNSLNNLLTFPWLLKKVKENELFIHAWYFELATGIIYIFNPLKMSFEKLEVV